MSTSGNSASNNPTSKTDLILGWLLGIGIVATLMLYRIGLWTVGYDRPCNCLGTMTDLFHISPEAVDLAMKILLSYLLIGSCVARFWLRGQPDSGSNEDVPKPASVLR
jgi:hypothetical protein